MQRNIGLSSDRKQEELKQTIKTKTNNTLYSTHPGLTLTSYCSKANKIRYCFYLSFWDEELVFTVKLMLSFLCHHNASAFGHSGLFQASIDQGISNLRLFLIYRVSFFSVRCPCLEISRTVLQFSLN